MQNKTTKFFRTVKLVQNKTAMMQNSKISAEQQNFTEQNLNFTEQWASMD